ncbi:MAG: tripartite tricarboxylate transporter permease [Candidatus Pacearchaeota archaeon]|jgi:putative membrane protein
MIIELIIAIFLGIIIGTITGLIPGIHINLVGSILLLSSTYLLTIVSPISLVCFIIAVAITHTFVDFIPSILLGAPNEDSILSVLPGHRLLLVGKGYEAVLSSLEGALTGIILFIIITPFFIFFLKQIYPLFQRIMGLILIISVLYLIYCENKKILASIIFLLSGFLGIAVLNLNLNEPLLPMLSGLFGASGIIISFNEKTKIPKQTILIKQNKYDKISFLKNIITSLVSSPLPAFLPGMGSSQAALIGTQINGKSTEKDFLFLIGSINIIVMSLSFITLFSINKIRTGASNSVSKLIPTLTNNDLYIIITTIILVGLISYFLSKYLLYIFINLIDKINYSKISLIVLFLLFIFTIIFSGFIGLLVFLVSTSLGIYCILSNVKRTILMGCLLIPTILFYIL